MRLAFSRAAAGEAAFEATEAGRDGDVERLLVAGAPATHRNKDGPTPVHVAARAGNMDVVRLLLNHGADSDAKDTYMRTPLFEAVCVGHLDVVLLLLDHGADPDKECYDGTTAIGNCPDEACRRLLANPESAQRWLRRRALAQWRASGGR